MVGADDQAQLRREAEAFMQPAGPEPSPESETTNAPLALGMAVAGLVRIGGDYVCARYRLTQLHPDEVSALGGALLNLAEAYGLLHKADPRMVAWATVAGVGASILGNRRKLPPPVDAEPKPADADTAAAS